VFLSRRKEKRNHEACVLYLITAPANKLDKKNRVSGWHFIPLDKKAKQEWRALLAPLKGKEVANVISSDLDAESANLAGDELHLPVRTDYIYRRFNFGRFHARDAGVADGALRAMEAKWNTNADVPIREGDSLTSFRKRFVKSFEKLLNSPDTSLFVTDSRTIHMIRGAFDPHAFIPNGNAIDPKKIFKVRKS
jgi:broad specificity phosphatase PhoE